MLRHLPHPAFRLVRELTGYARGTGAVAVTGRAVPGGFGTPYRPLTEALLQIPRDRPLPPDAGLRAWRPALQAILPSLGPAKDAGLLPDISAYVQASTPIPRDLEGAA